MRISKLPNLFLALLACSTAAAQAFDYDDIADGRFRPAQLAGIRPTAVRLLIYKTALRFHDTFSMSELEDALESVDKSTVFRTLLLFAARHLLHEIEDGSGSTKYCICRNDRPCGIDELHCHFHCEACRKTFCLDYTHIPAVRYPAGFEVRQIDYLLKGLCPDCRAKRHV